MSRVTYYQKAYCVVSSGSLFKCTLEPLVVIVSQLKLTATVYIIALFTLEVKLSSTKRT